MPRVDSRCQPPWCFMNAPTQQLLQRDLPAVLLVRSTAPETMIGRPQRDQRLAGIEVVVELSLLNVGQLQVARHPDQAVRARQMLQTRHSMPPGPVLEGSRQGRIDLAVLVDAEEHRGVESVMLRQDPGQHRQGLLGPVLLLGGDQHDVLALAGTLAPGKGQPQLALRNRMIASVLPHRPPRTSTSTRSGRTR